MLNSNNLVKITNSRAQKHHDRLSPSDTVCVQSVSAHKHTALVLREAQDIHKYLDGRL